MQLWQHHNDNIAALMKENAMLRSELEDAKRPITPKRKTSRRKNSTLGEIKKVLPMPGRQRKQPSIRDIIRVNSLKQNDRIQTKDDKTLAWAKIIELTSPENILVEWGGSKNKKRAHESIETKRKIIAYQRTRTGSLDQEGAMDRRRRIAQREFSSRRDSPVMVRLLEQIIAAQDD